MLSYAYDGTYVTCGLYTRRVVIDGARLKAWRSTREWSLDDLAGRAGIDRQTIHRIETTPRKKTRFSTAKKLAQAFGVPVAHLEAKPRSNRREASRDDSVVGESGGARIEDSLGELLRYIKALEGEQRTAFIKGVVGMLTALDTHSGESTQRASGHDG